MPKNPERRERGGDVSGTTRTDNQWGVGDAVEVAEASFDPGYSLENTWGNEAGSGASLSQAELKQGYSSYGVKKVGQ